jgi:hypothetical protein
MKMQHLWLPAAAVSMFRSGARDEFLLEVPVLLFITEFR